MKKKAIAILMTAVLAVSLAACGGSSGGGSNEPAAEATTEAQEASSDLIKVGIINNDPNESGYRTANDKDLKSMFTKENGYDASFAYSLKNAPRSSSRTALTISSFPQRIHPAGIPYCRMLRMKASVSSFSTVPSTPAKTSIQQVSFPTWTRKARQPLNGWQVRAWMNTRSSTSRALWVPLPSRDVPAL